MKGYNYILEHRGNDWSYVVSIFPNRNLAVKAMEYYAKYVEWNWNTKQVGRVSDWQIDFDNLQFIRIKEERKVTSMKEFKLITPLPNESK